MLAKRERDAAVHALDVKGQKAAVARAPRYSCRYQTRDDAQIIGRNGTEPEHGIVADWLKTDDSLRIFHETTDYRRRLAIDGREQSGATDKKGTPL